MIDRRLLMWATLASGAAISAIAAEQLKWEELEPRVRNKKIAFVLPDGTQVKGKALAVERDGLRVKVTESSNRAAQPKGKHLIARDALSLLEVTEHRKRGGLLGALGAAAIAGGIVAAQQIDIYEGPAVIIVPLVVAGGIAGSAIGGYYVGKALDKKVTQIRIVPDATGGGRYQAGPSLTAIAGTAR